MLNDLCTLSSLNLCSLKNELSSLHFFNPTVLLSIAVNWWKLRVPGMVNTLIAFAMNFSSISYFFFLQKRKIWFHLYFHCKNQKLLWLQDNIFPIKTIYFHFNLQCYHSKVHLKLQDCYFQYLKKINIFSIHSQKVWCTVKIKTKI